MIEPQDRNDHKPDGQEAVPTGAYGGGAVGPGAVIGRYKLLRILGEGGYGIVYLAEQQRPVKRRVALKVIKPGMDTKQVIARFEAERQALALLDHPNIAHVFNAGTTEAGRPYFAMEYVKGVPITEHCDRYKLTIEERLKLFLAVCEAVQHAHQKAIIHRDIKPSNILIAYEGEQAVPMIIDFGVAKALTQPLTERTLVTEQAQMIGTPEYMSPEQAEMTSQDIDTRTDVYSLGVLLYELLTGTLPFDPKTLREGGPDQMRRLIREQDPQTPSARLSTIENEKSLDLAQHRRTDIRTWGHHLHGELDWITLKAMDKDRTRRYQTAHALAEDVQRYLKQEPVLAGPPRATYKLRKFVARNRSLFVSATAVAVVVVLAAFVSIVLAITATKAQQLAEKATQAEALQRKKAEDLAEKQEEDLYFNYIRLAHQELKANRPVHALDLLEKCPEHLRNWEWHYLQRKCHFQEAQSLEFEAGVLSFAFSPDGVNSAALLINGKLILQDWTTGKASPYQVRNKLKQLHDDCSDWLADWVVFSPDGKHLAVAGDDYVVELISLVSHEIIDRFNRHTDTVTKIVWAPDGGFIATASRDGTLGFWNRHNGDQRVLHLRSKPVNLAFTGDGRYLIVCYGGGDTERFSIGDIVDGKTSRGVTKQMADPFGIAVSPDGERIATALWDGTILLADGEYAELMRLEGHVDLAMGVAFSDDGTRIASIGEDLTVRLWDTATGQQVLSIGAGFFFNQPVFSRDGHRLFLIDRTRALTVFDGSPFAGVQDSKATILRGRSASITTTVHYSPSGQQVISSGDNGTILWDAATGQLESIVCTGDLRTHDGHFSPDGKCIASCCVQQGRFYIKVWGARPPHRERLSVEFTRAIEGAIFSHDGRYLVIGGEEGILHVYDWQSRAEIGQLGDQGFYVGSMAASPDGRYLASTGLDGTIRIWDATRLDEPQEGRLIYQARNNCYFYAAFSPDGKQLALGEREGDIRILDLETEEVPLLISKAHGDKVNCISFGPRGRYLASCSSDKTVRVWNAETGDPVDVLLGHKGRVLSVAFSPDGKHVVSGGIDSEVRIWTPRLE